MPGKVSLGLDVGSVGLKAVVLSAGGDVLREDYVRTNGRPFQAVASLLADIALGFPLESVQAAAVTGSAGEEIAAALGARFVNEIVALSAGIEYAAPQARTAIEMGGEDSKLLLFEPKTEGSGRVLRDFSMNSLCAAGTGSFLDQQATRLGVRIEDEFGALALGAGNPPRIAGRCSVFAKSDMIHLQQMATPVEDIAAGLCLALARSFKSTVGKAMDFAPPVAFLGGVASNAGMVWAFEQVLDLPPGALVVPPRHRSLGAYGAVRIVLNAGESTAFRGAQGIEDYLENRKTGSAAASQPPLRQFLTPSSTPDSSVCVPAPLIGGNGGGPDGARAEAYLGIDVGSISTNLVVTDAHDRVLAKRYLRTASRPIEAVRQGLEEIGTEIGDHIEVRGVGTTGSGRYLIGELVGADVIRNEITAQATAAILIDPRVDTIFEIGGQDSKYISIDHGTVRDFEMNRACAAGTGSFLEEQAERLGVDIKNEFSDLALSALSPVALGDRCTVFMESDIVHHQQSGSATPDLLGGLAYSIVHNYLNRVVGDRRVGECIFFQGGTAFNKAVVAAFNSVTGKEIIVPPHHEVTGAIGAAILARRHAQEAAAETGQTPASGFRGFDFSRLDYQIRSFTCKSCDNMCEIRQVRLEGREPVHYGSRCEKYDVDRDGSAASTPVEAGGIPDLFAERRGLLLGDGAAPASPKGVVGIPLTLMFIENLPFWRAFFETLGFEVVLSAETTKRTVRRGVERVAFEACFPVKVAHGHLLDLVDRRPDFIFLPSIIDSKTEDFGEKDAAAFNCPLVQTIPYTVRGSLDFDALGVPLFSPSLRMQWGIGHLEKTLSKHSDILRADRHSIRAALRAAEKAQENFAAALEQQGREVLASLSEERPGVVVVSRPYNGCDPGMNLDLPRKLRKLGVVPIPLDMLPLSEHPLPEKWREVYWRYGQRILKAARIIRGEPNLFAVYVTNFNCGPDSFVMEFFREEMTGPSLNGNGGPKSGKPYLQLEIDEHSADAGLITRCEAFLDTLENVGSNGARRSLDPPAFSVRRFTNHRCLYLPNMSPHAHPIAAAIRASGGDAQVMAASDDESVTLGQRTTSGRECYPCLLTTGDMVRQTQRKDFDPTHAAFFMPSTDGPCRFGQYTHLHRRVLDHLGLKQVPILSIDQDGDYRRAVSGMGSGFERRAWRGIVAVDALEKVLLNTRPYETEPGTTDAWFWDSVQRVCNAIERRDDLWRALEEIAERSRTIECDAPDDRPLIGVVGEVYVRTNVFANQDLVRQIERLGGRVAAPTMAEWMRYTSTVRRVRSRHFHRYRELITDYLVDRATTRDERRIYSLLDLEPDPGPRELFEYARPYLDSSFQGEAILTIGKAVEMIREMGVAGIVNTMPFGCMPGMICTALLKRVREDHGSVPVYHAAFTGQQELNNHVRLEAFLHQAREFGVGTR